MKWVHLSSSGKKPSIYDKDLRCPYCKANHTMDENGRIIGLSFIGSSTAGMTPEQAEDKGADLAVKSTEAIEFYSHPLSIQ